MRREVGKLLLLAVTITINRCRSRCHYWLAMNVFVGCSELHILKSNLKSWHSCMVNWFPPSHSIVLLVSNHCRWTMRHWHRHISHLIFSKLIDSFGEFLSPQLAAVVLTAPVDALHPNVTTNGGIACRNLWMYCRNTLKEAKSMAQTKNCLTWSCLLSVQRK